MDKENINMFSSPVVRVESGGSEFLVVVLEDVMEVLLRVSVIMLAKPMTMTMMMPMESRPPVTVLYWVSELYLRSWFEQKKSAWRISLLIFRRNIDYKWKK